jgi:hypothetical protein
MLAMLGTWYMVLRKTVCREPAQERANGKAVRSELSKPVGAHVITPRALNAIPGAIGLSDCPTGFWSCFGPFLPRYGSVPPFLK